MIAVIQPHCMRYEYFKRSGYILLTLLTRSQVKIRMLCALLFFVLSGCATLPYAIEPNAVTDGETTGIYVASHGWHTGIIVPSAFIYTKLPELKQRFSDVNFFEIGWGDAGFYQANEITSGLTFQAIFLPTQSVVHIVGFNDAPSVYFSSSVVEPIKVHNAHISSLLAFIANSFQRDENNALMMLRKGIYGDSQFYAGIGSYYAFNTCNKWTAKALYSAGVDISPMLKLTAPSVMAVLKETGP